MKYTLIPPNDPPAQYTASCPEIGRLLMNSPDGNLTIDQTRDSLLPGPIGIDFEARLREIFKEKQK
jgi:hypothetical protein